MTLQELEDRGEPLLVLHEDVNGGIRVGPSAIFTELRVSHKFLLLTCILDVETNEHLGSLLCTVGSEGEEALIRW